ncbi:unnamed protein product [Orchesella dallaii]|uniref:Carbonic anhydrase n=1 Tax=Orchesella dallaii TaxID=48710 RepID=A0ABP1QJY6_9HEXA
MSQIRTMDKILKGIMRYRDTVRTNLVEEFVKIRDNPQPKAVFFTCMDSRMLPTRFTQTHVGDMFIVRNAGNLVPHSKWFVAENTTTEPAALELGCVINNIKHVIVCGHSDCKAMNLLYELDQNKELATAEQQRLSPLKGWLCNHGAPSLQKFRLLQKNGFKTPLMFEAEIPVRRFVAYIDPEDKFSVADKLSQVNCLQQLQNIASYGFLREILSTGKAYIHALWFDIYTGDIYYFSRQKKRFIDVNETTFPQLMEEVEMYYC